VPFPDDMGSGRYVLYEPVTLGLPCTDVRRFDVQNMAFRVRNPRMQGRLEFRFRNGRSRRADTPEFSTLSWRTAVDRGRVVTLSDGNLLRFVSIEDSHVSSTTMHYVSALSCRDGTMIEVFQAGGEGVFLDHRRTPDDTIRLRWCVWRRGDSHAEPSRERIQDLAWMPSFGQFAIVRNEEREIKR
jgi:hypothetical protein